MRGVAMSLTEDQIKQVKSLQKKFNAELDKLLQDWIDTVKNELAFVTIAPGQFILLGAIANVMCHAFEPYNFSDEYIQACIEEHMAWLDRKTKEYESRN